MIYAYRHKCYSVGDTEIWFKKKKSLLMTEQLYLLYFKCHDLFLSLAATQQKILNVCRLMNQQVKYKIGQ